MNYSGFLSHHRIGPTQGNPREPKEIQGSPLVPFLVFLASRSVGLWIPNAPRHSKRISPSGVRFRVVAAIAGVRDVLFHVRFGRTKPAPSSLAAGLESVCRVRWRGSAQEAVGRVVIGRGWWCDIWRGGGGAEGYNIARERRRRPQCFKRM